MATILIAEDEPDIRALITIALENQGHRVTAVADGETALETIARERPDLVLLDVRMPRLDGYEVCRRIKSETSLRHIPIAFMSAKAQEAEVRAGIEAGAEAYILKPFSMQQLLDTVEEILGP